jgi:membrane protease YdiL (CAAX protease family)
MATDAPPLASAPPPDPVEPGFWWRLLMPVVAVIAGLVGLVVVVVAATTATSGGMADAIAATAGSAIILAAGLALVRHLPRHEVRRIFAAKATTATTVVTGIGFGVLLTITSAVIIAVGLLIDPGLGGDSRDIAAPLGPGVAGTLIVICGVIALAPLGEELLFRGIMLRGLVRRCPFWPAAVISAVVFAACHADVLLSLMWPRYIALAVVGVVLAALNRSHGYWCGVTAHATVNTLATIAVLLAG